MATFVFDDAVNTLQEATERATDAVELYGWLQEAAEWLSDRGDSPPQGAIARIAWIRERWSRLVEIRNNQIFAAELGEYVWGKAIEASFANDSYPDGFSCWFDLAQQAADDAVLAIATTWSLKGFPDALPTELPPVSDDFREVVMMVDEKILPPMDVKHAIAELRREAARILTVLERIRDETEAKEQEEEPRHGPDFRSVKWPGSERFVFTPSQAAVVKILWEAFQSGTPEVSEDHLCEKACVGKIGDLFRGHDSLGVMIHRAGKGLWMLKKVQKKGNT